MFKDTRFSLASHLNIIGETRETGVILGVTPSIREMFSDRDPL